MRARTHIKREKVYSANAGDIRIKGTARQIISRLESLAQEAFRNENAASAHTYLQTAEHYKRIDNNG